MTKVLQPGEVAVPLVREYGYSQECSACRGQYSDLRYVDFDAACDRGFYGDEKKITNDDLVLCANCVKDAARKLDMIGAGEWQAEKDQLEAQNRELLKRAEKAENYADRLEDALTHLRSDPIRVDHRQKPRPAREPKEAD